VHTRLIPEREFDSIIEPNLIVNHAEVVPHNMGIDSELVRYLTVCEPFCHKLNDALLLWAWRSVLVSKKHAISKTPSRIVDIFQHSAAGVGGMA